MPEEKNKSSPYSKYLNSKFYITHGFYRKASLLSHIEVKFEIVLFIFFKLGEIAIHQLQKKINLIWLFFCLFGQHMRYNLWNSNQINHKISLWDGDAICLLQIPFCILLMVVKDAGFSQLCFILNHRTQLIRNKSLQIVSLKFSR